MTSKKENTRAENSEISVLGSIIQDGEMIVKADVSPSDFYSTQKQEIYSVMKDMQRRSVPIDVSTLLEEIQKMGKEAITGGFQYLCYLIDATPSTANFDYHLRKVKEASLMRELWETSQRLSQATVNGADRETIMKLGAEIEKLSRLEVSKDNIICLADYEPKEMSWLLENAIPDKFPSTIYGDGGLGKSYLGLYFSILAALGNQKFLGLKFPHEPLNVLYLDWELDVDEFSRRALRIAKGLGLTDIPTNLYYYSPGKSLYKLIPELKGILESKSIGFSIIDSLGASCVDPENVVDVVEIFNQIKSLGIATLILDHQSKMQSKDNYDAKTPYGSVYKYNLSRSVFQLSKIGAGKNSISLMLKQKKSNFGRLLDDLVFDISFEGDRVMFFESEVLSPEKKEMMLIHEAIGEMEAKGEEVIQKNIVFHLRGVLGKDKILSLLDKGEGKYWSVRQRQGRGGGKIYESKEVFEFSEYIYKPKTRKLPSEDFDIPEVIA